MDPVTLALLTAAISGAAGAGANKLMSGGEGEFKQRSRLNKQQQPLFTQLINATQNPGAGGAFGTAADYYRDLLSNDSKTMEMLTAPEMRRFNEQIIPDLSEQFAGMGAGGLSSSGFRNAAVNAGTDLSERLGAIRAGLRQQGAQGLANLGSQGLDDYTINTYQNPDQGGWQDLAQTGAEALTSYAASNFNQPPSSPNTATVPGTNIPSGGGLPNFSTQARMPISSKGKSNPYGRVPGSSQLPSFQTTMRGF